MKNKFMQQERNFIPGYKEVLLGLKAKAFEDEDEL